MGNILVDLEMNFLRMLLYYELVQIKLFRYSLLQNCFHAKFIFTN